MKKIKIPVEMFLKERSVLGFASCGSSGSSRGCGGVYTGKTDYSSSFSGGGCSSGGSRVGSVSTCGSTYSSVSRCGSSATITRQATACSNSGGSQVATTSSPTVSKQTPYNSKDVHCDIQAHNTAEEKGYFGGAWDGNKKTVDTIYKDNYKANAKDSVTGDAGYGFVDVDKNGTYDHMFFYSTNNGKTTIYDSNGVNPVKAYDGNSLLTGYYGNADVKFTGLKKK